MDRDQFNAEARYAIRLCQRTARLYRRIQSAGTFVSILGGSATLAGVAAQLHPAVAGAGVVSMAIAGAALIAIRPADKAANNEADVRRYQALMAKSATLDDGALQQALDEARQGDAQEVEPLRNVAYNDMVLEINRPDQLIPLTAGERLLKSLA